MARPKKATSDKREQWIKARVSPAEHADSLVRAAGSGLSPSEFLRRSALSGEVVVQQPREGDFETIDQLRRMGVNLNQLARVANQTGHIPDGLEEALARVDRVLDRMIET